MSELTPLLELTAGAMQALMVGAYAAAQTGLAIVSSHRYAMLFSRGDRATSPPAAPEKWPLVTVQLPVFNERHVVQRLIDAVAALDYPRERLQVQVLDDSTDETRAIASEAVARHRAVGLDIEHLTRASRRGFKAGALADGLARARGDLLAVFDADFVPPPEFLRRLVPWFSDRGVGMAQARWGHLNRDASWLTRAQATMLDAHFLLEHAMRMRRGLFFNFNGTAGLWRRACIEDAGGWSHDTLTEDLDLSYRAQLTGWRFVFDPAVVCPAELPADMRAFLSQQRRWSKGSIQTARKVLPALWGSGVPLRTRLEGTLHLTSNGAYPLLLLLGLLLLPVMLGRSLLSPAAVWSLHVAVLVLGILPVALFLYRGQRQAGQARRASLGGALSALLLGIGLSVNNARAVFSGLGRAVGDWERTPKRGDTTPALATYRSVAGLAGRTELALALYFGALLVWAASAVQLRALPFLLLLAVGFAWVGRASLRESVAAARG